MCKGETGLCVKNVFKTGLCVDLQTSFFVDNYKPVSFKLGIVMDMTLLFSLIPA